MTQIAFLGLGAMGRPVARRLLEAGHDLHVWPAGRDTELVAGGARRAATPADAAREAEVAFTMLADPPALEQVLFGPGGVAGATGRRLAVPEAAPARYDEAVAAGRADDDNTAVVSVVRSAG